MPFTLLFLAVVAAQVDWLATGGRRARPARIARPLAVALLVATAARADLGPGHWWVVAALAARLAVYVVALLRARRPIATRRALPAALAVFAAGDACLLVAFARHGLHPLYALAGVLVVVGCTGLVLPRLLAAVRAKFGRRLAVVVSGYAVLLGATTVLAVATGSPAVAIGGVLLLVADAAFVLCRSVRAVRPGALFTTVPYHAAQLLIVIGLIGHW